jgi:hypothetical protein
MVTGWEACGARAVGHGRRAEGKRAAAIAALDESEPLGAGGGAA